MESLADRRIEQKFPCKEDGCSEIVGFLYSPVFGRGDAKDSPLFGQQTRAYLTCRNSHVHPYNVIIE